MSCVRNDDFLNKIRRSIKKFQWILKCNLKSATIWKNQLSAWLITQWSWLLITRYSNAIPGRKDSKEIFSFKTCGILISLGATFMCNPTRILKKISIHAQELPLDPSLDLAYRTKQQKNVYGYYILDRIMSNVFGTVWQHPTQFWFHISTAVTTLLRYECDMFV